ncbi:hypothetical protein D9757_005406 [Collybiopsis confluens]|uniref:Uncharacterized protein n=1 Tax=Collybiopsis confluens TaxID=2823264 RepID=A0A8H5HLU3_9AGAR|nr:hypothetical protein D9757_005406 [Collybiopsis confluens]
MNFDFGQPSGQLGVNLNNLAPLPDFRPLNSSASQGVQPTLNPMNLVQWAATQQPHQYQNAQMLQQPLNHQWNNMAPPPQYPNSMNAGMMNVPTFPFLSQQMLQDALALSTPVAGQDDDKVLIDCLVQAQTRHDNYKNALNSLHGKNAHSASLWKDFYLEHKDRIDSRVSNMLKRMDSPSPSPPTRTVVAKKPDISSFRVESSISPPPVSKRRRPPKTSTPNSIASTSSAVNIPSKSSRRSTINSITAHAPSYSSRLPAPNAELRIPVPPSRSPIPPSRLVPHAKGYRFTQEDKDFFIKFIQWRMRGDASLTRNELCEQLAEKVPHHNFASWYAYWQNNHDLPDKILAAAYGDGEEKDESDASSILSEDETEVKHWPRQSKYREESSPDSEGEERDESPFTLPSFDENQMGVAGASFTSTDLSMVARYVASFESFSAGTYSEKWKPWNRRYPQRSYKSWAEYYRRNERDILSLAKRIKKAGAAKGLSPIREPLEAQFRSSSIDAGGPPKAKRKFSSDEQESEDNGSRTKIGKIQ